MGSSLIYETQNVEVIKAFVTPEIFEEIAEDGHKYEEFEPNFRLGYLVQKMEDFEGLWILERRNGVTYCVHPAIPKQYRGRKAYRAAKEFYCYLVENIDFEKLIAETPVIYKNVKLFALQNGLQVEGKLKQSYRKYGQLHDQWILGITKPQIEAIL